MLWHIYEKNIKPVFYNFFYYFRITPFLSISSHITDNDKIPHSNQNLKIHDYMLVFINAYIVYFLVLLTSSSLVFFTFLSFLPNLLLSSGVIKTKKHDLIDIHRVEKRICQLHNNRIIRKTFSLPNVNGYNVHMKYLVSYPAIPCDKNEHHPILLLIHGIGGSAMGIMVSTFAQFSETYEIHSLDLPGFGISSIETLNGYSFLNQTPEKIVDFYVKCIGQYIAYLKHSKAEITVLAHSFGGFLSAPLGLQQTPSEFRPNRILLYNPAGIFPLLGEYGAYWSLFFGLHLPFSFMRLLKPWFTLYVTHCLANFSNKTPDFLQRVYYIQHLLNKDAQGSQILNRFIHRGFFWTNWRLPCLTNLLRMSIPCVLLYGENDQMIPPHQGRFLADVFQIPYICIPEVGHIPYSENPELFRESVIKSFVLTKSINNAQNLNERYERIAHELEKKLEKKNWWTPFHGCFSIYVTNKMILEQYAFIRKMKYGN